MSTPQKELKRDKRRTVKLEELDNDLDEINQWLESSGIETEKTTQKPDMNEIIKNNNNNNNNTVPSLGLSPANINQTSLDTREHPQKSGGLSQSLTGTSSTPNNSFLERTLKRENTLDSLPNKAASPPTSPRRGQKSVPYAAVEAQPWFFGDLDKISAEALLLDSGNENSFLIRREHGKLFDHPIYAVSLFNFGEHKIQHIPVLPVQYGKVFYQLDGSAKIYKDIIQFVENAHELQNYKMIKPKRGGLSLSGRSVRSATFQLSDFFPTKQTHQAEEMLSIFKNQADIDPNSDISQKLLEDARELDIETIQEEVETLLGSTNYAHIGRMKESLSALLETQEKVITQHDKKLIAQTENNNNAANLLVDRSDNQEYLNLCENVAALSEELNRLRLHGDEFRIIHKGENKIFKITQESQILFVQVKRTTNKQVLVPPDMSKFVYYNIKVLGEPDKTEIYEIASATMMHPIDQVAKIQRDFGSTHGKSIGISITWKNSKKSSFTVAIPGEADELMATVNSHIRKYQKSTSKQIQLIKDIWSCKSTTYNSSSLEHQSLLRRLWKILMPNTSSEGLVSQKWKYLGFQGNDPSTDFRGMGLLGLLNLIYIAENYTSEIRKILDSNRDYPWAVAGINITALLLDVLGVNEQLITKKPHAPEWNKHVLKLFYYADSEDTFDELYSRTFLLFDRLWTHMKATYFDFGQVSGRLKDMLKTLIERNPLTMEQLVTWVDQLRSAF